MTDPPAATRRSPLDRLLALYPLLIGYLVLVTLYGWQTTKHPTPWLFTDELEWAERSRGVAHHGVPQLRFHDASFSSLYSYLIAPAWWFGATGPAYAAAKYINAFVMTATLFPAYALARLFVPRLPALACGLAAAAIPSLAYTGLLIPEPLAYLWSTVALWLLARALLRPSRGTIAWAVASIVVAPAFRSQLSVLVLAGLVAAGAAGVSSGRGRSVVRAWSWRERIGALVLTLGAAVFLGAFANQHSTSWQIGTHFHHRAFTYGLWAFGAFAIGVGVLPVFGALAWLLGNRFRTREERALGGTLLGTVVAFGLYTAVKASYLSTNFAIRVEERNLIYIAPVVFAATAFWVVHARTRIVPVVLSAGAVWYLLDTTPYHNYEHFYSDAPGLAILQWLNRTWYWTTADARRLLFGILIGSVLLALARRPLRRVATPVAALLAVAVVGWNLTGEIAAADASNSFAHDFRGTLPTPPNWIDNATGRARTMFIGQSLQGSNAFWSLEFWNQSITDVWSVDATAPGPGPVTTPNFLSTTGALDPQLPLSYVVATPGVDPVGSLVEAPVGGLRLYHVPHPIRLSAATGGISPDGWMTTGAWTYRFAPNGPRRGTASVSLSRAAACGSFAPSRITIRVTRLRIDSDGQPIGGKTLAMRHATVHSDPCETKVVKIPVSTPYRIDVSASGTFQPSQYDLRNLSAQVGFGWQPRSS